MKASRLAALFLLTLLPAAPLRAQPPGGPPPRPAAAPRDTTRILPPWLRGWVEFGGGWLSGPAYMKPLYDSGQGFGAGLEARPGGRWAVRSGLDYQMLMANDRASIILYDPFAYPGYTDTMTVETQTTGWLLAERTELGVRLPAGFWLTAGGGGGYMHSGLSGLENVALSSARVMTSGAVANGWGWLWTAAARWDFEPAPRVPLGIDVRTSALHRGPDEVRTWSVRVCYRMPEPLPRSAEPPRRRWR